MDPTKENGVYKPWFRTNLTVTSLTRQSRSVPRCPRRLMRRHLGPRLEGEDNRGEEDSTQIEKWRKEAEMDGRPEAALSYRKEKRPCFTQSRGSETVALTNTYSIRRMRTHERPVCLSQMQRKRVGHMPPDRTPEKTWLLHLRIPSILGEERDKKERMKNGAWLKASAGCSLKPAHKAAQAAEGEAETRSQHS